MVKKVKKNTHTVSPQVSLLFLGFLLRLLFLTQVCGGSALDLFEAKELELLICGNSVLDFHDLRQGTSYEDGLNFFPRIIHGLLCVFTKSEYSFINFPATMKFPKMNSNLKDLY